MTPDGFVEYAEHRTGTEMQQLLHHGHWIPVLRGYTASFVAEHFPGWSWNDLLAVCRAADLVDPTSGGGGPLRCDPRVRAFHFTNEHTFAVEWNDGTVSVGQPWRPLDPQTMEARHDETGMPVPDAATHQS